MKRNTYYPSRQAEQAAWLINYANKIGGYAAVLGLTAGQVAATTGDARWLAYVLLTWLPAVRAWALGCTDALTEARRPGVAATRKSCRYSRRRRCPMASPP